MAFFEYEYSNALQTCYSYYNSFSHIFQEENKKTYKKILANEILCAICIKNKKSD